MLSRQWTTLVGEADEKYYSHCFATSLLSQKHFTRENQNGGQITRSLQFHILLCKKKEELKRKSPAQKNGANKTRIGRKAFSALNEKNFHSRIEVELSDAKCLCEKKRPSDKKRRFVSVLCLSSFRRSLNESDCKFAARIA